MKKERKKGRRMLAVLLSFAMFLTCCMQENLTVLAAAKKPSKITLNYKQAEMSAGDTLKLRVKSVSPKNASKQVKWKSSNPKVASVSSAGKVKGKKNGTVTVTAVSKSNPKAAAKCKIKVYKATKSLAVAGQKSYTLEPGKTVTLKTKMNPAKGAQPVRWSSKNKKVSKVSTKGKVSAVSEGVTTITGKSGRKKVTVKVTVKKAGNPAPNPTPMPEPNPTPIPDPNPAPWPNPTPNPNPNPNPKPKPKPELSPTPTPDSDSKPISKPDPDSKPGSDSKPSSPGRGTWFGMEYDMDDDGCLVIKGTFLNLDNEDFSWDSAPWAEEKEQVISAKVDVSGLRSMYRMFADYVNLENVDFCGTDTGNVTNMSYMFDSCFDLTSLDLSSFNTGNVTDMSYMFNCCFDLTSLDLSSFNTGNVTDMSDMFSSCDSLTSINLSNFNTGNVTDMDFMFFYCGSLTSLDMSSFSISKTEFTIGLFSGSGLEEIKSPKVCRESGIELPGEFQDENGTSYSERPLTNGESITLTKKGSTSTPTIPDDDTWFGMEYDLDENGKLMIKGTFLNPENEEFSWESAPWAEKKEQVISVEVDVAGLNNMSGMFKEYKNLADVNFLGTDTGNVTNMGAMFNECSSLTSLDLSGFDTKNVTDMGSMFNGCSSLTSLDVSSFHTENVSKMWSMFARCSGLTSLDLSSFDTGNVTDMWFMFADCSGLTSLDLSSFDTRNVTEMWSMFLGCSGLTSLDLSSFIINETTSTANMFLNLGLREIKSPKLCSQSGIELSGEFQDENGASYSELPLTNGKSITLTRNGGPI